MEQKACLYPGSFDPVTNGHMSVIRRASQLFDKVYVAVLRNMSKQNGRPADVRVELLKAACADLPNTQVITFDGLTSELARSLGARWLVRGLRGTNDLESELTMSRVNRMLNPQLETVFFGPEPGMEDISSSLVRELVSMNGDITAFVPQAVHARIITLYGQKR